MNEIFKHLRGARAIACNHLGYACGGVKRAVLCLGEGEAFVGCGLFSAVTGANLYTRPLPAPVAVSGWKGQRYQIFDFTSVETAERVYIEAEVGGEVCRSSSFEIGDNLQFEKIPPMLLGYFQSQRNAGRYEEKDAAMTFVGERTDTVDVRGGWYDASGDVSKYLSHLSYANYMNPQQTPLVVWSLAEASADSRFDPDLAKNFAAESAWGADFLVRMFDVCGAFYMTVFDRWSGETDQREICSYSTQKGHKHSTWEAGFRQGGGMAIAALAKVARLGISGTMSSDRYLEVGEAGFWHLCEHNVSYLDDGRENVIDDYCALFAACELFLATGKSDYRDYADRRADSLIARISKHGDYEGWLRADDAGARPFAHAADEGLPILALTIYADIVGPDRKGLVGPAIEAMVAHIIAVTGEVENPFSYPRQFVLRSDGTLGTQFFFPHENESGYWWQGENARLGSLSCALRRAAPYLSQELETKASALAVYALDWILGLNPFHAGMLQGVGKNWPVYGPAKFPNHEGGICNGITSSLWDENELGFCETEDPYQSWRWSEQWLPHAAWFLLAVLSEEDK